MSRVVVTGIGSVGPAGIGRESLEAALAEGRSPAKSESIEVLRGARRDLSVARLAPFEREQFVPARKLRRMGELSQIWVIACMLAERDAGLAGTDRESAPYAPESRGTYLGTGFGCIDTNWEYLVGMYKDGAGMANPFLFSESVANAPAGHSAIELSTRGATITFTCADASGAAAVEFGARAIREGRVTMAYCGGIELLCEPLMRVIATMGSITRVGEGAVCLILESLDTARARGARIYAEIAGSGSASDPSAGAVNWGSDTTPLRVSITRAVKRAGGEVSRVWLHAPPAPAAASAEREVAESVCPGAAMRGTTDMFGTLAAAGGFNIAAAVLDASRGGATLVNATSWGGSIFSIVLRAAGRSS